MLRVLITSLVIPIFSQSIASGKITLLPKKLHTYIYNFLCVLLTYSFFNVIFWQYEFNFLIVITLFYIISLIMYYIHEFRGTNINFSDILSINTAKEVAGGYTYEIRPIFVFCFLIILIEYIIQIAYNKIDLLYYYNTGFMSINNEYMSLYRYFLHEIAQFLLFIFIFNVLRDIISINKYDYSLMAGEKEGYIYNFFSSMQVFHKNKVDLSGNNYEENGDFQSSIEVNYEPTFNSLFTENAHKFDNIKDITKPHVIVIMNESFGSVHNRIKTNIAVTPYYDSLKNVIKGDLYVNTFGGGTANTEFEFLTGMTIGNYPYPVMPYNNFVKRDKYSLARYFNHFGYQTVAMHPYTATNYNRDKVYKRFGFDELLFFDDFKDKKYVRNYTSDLSMYEEVIRRFEIIKGNNKMAFIFGITMQNHSGYNSFDGQEIKSLFDVTDNIKDKESLDAYLSLMKISDSAIKLLIDYFKSEKDPVVLLFFGDHNASFGTDINKLVYDNNFEYECTNTYVTPFFIYNNKSDNNKQIKGVSANFLSLELLNEVGLPYDDVHQLLDSVYKNYSIYNFHKMKRPNDDTMLDIPYDDLMKYEKEYLK